MRFDLGVNSYSTRTNVASDDILDLSWTIDERACLDIDLHKFIKDFMLEEANAANPSWTQYPVSDPYGANKIRESADYFFSSSFKMDQITVGAGVSGLLAYLSTLDVSNALFIEPIYPDLVHWIDRRKINFGISDLNIHSSPDLVFLENPNFLSGISIVDTLEQICGQVSGDTLIVVDESNANYLTLARSAVPLVNSMDNLVVLRGFSKGYGLGSLRIGVSFASRNICELIRSVCPPLNFTPLSLAMAEQLWRFGDVKKHLRAEIASKNSMFSSLIGNFPGLTLLQSNVQLPYLIFPVDQKKKLEFLGIRAKSHRLVTKADRFQTVCRMSLPLTEERQSHLLYILGKNKISLD